MENLIHLGLLFLLRVDIQEAYSTSSQNLILCWIPMKQYGRINTQLSLLRQP